MGSCINICGHTFPPEITGAVVTSSKGAGSQLQMTDTLVGAEIRYSHKTIVCRTVVAWPTETNRTVATIYMEQMKLCTSDRVGIMPARGWLVAKFLVSVSSCLIASLLGHCHQCLIAYSIQIRRRKAWEIWSHQ